MESQTRFVVTAWRDSQELLQVRQDLYSSETSRRERAVNKVFAWRLRKPHGLPLLLDSTADIVDVVLQDERDGLKHNAMRLLYATAISRFVTGLADTQIDLSRDRPLWFPPGKSLQLPLTLLETRHRIVHRHLPTLGELKRAATESLDWLWEWYWSQLDHAFKPSNAGDEADGEELGVESKEVIKERLQGILKSYIKERKSEIKSRKKDSKAPDNAISTYTLRFANNQTTTSASQQPQRLLLDLLINDTMILPADKKLGSNMSGAFLIWSPLLHSLCVVSPAILRVQTILQYLMSSMNAPPSSSRSTVNPEMDPIREGLYDWIVHILSSDDWADVRGTGTGMGIAQYKLLEHVLSECFSNPSFWNLKIAAALLNGKGVPNREQWSSVLDAAMNEKDADADMAEMDMEGGVEGIEEAMPVVLGKVGEGMVREKRRGPQKVLGLWKARPIGWLPEGCEDDE